MLKCRSKSVKNKIFFTILIILSIKSQAIDFNLKQCEDVRNQRLERALDFLQKIKWIDIDKSKDQTYYSEFSKEKSPYKYVTGLFSNIKYVDCGESLKNTVAYVNQGESIINFCKKQDDCTATNNTSEDILDVATTLVHEARHVENPKVTHVKCEEGALKSQIACDVSRSARGGYHFETDFIVGLSRNENLNPSLRFLSSHLAIYDLLNHFQNMPDVDFDKNILVQDSNLNLYLLDADLQLSSLNYSSENKIYDGLNGDFFSFDNKKNKFKFKMYKFNGNVIYPQLAFRYNTMPEDDSKILDYQIIQNGNTRYEVLLFSKYFKIFQQWISKPTVYDEPQLKTYMSKIEFPNALNITGIVPSSMCSLDFNETLFVNNKKTVHRLIFDDEQTITFREVDCKIDFSKIKNQKKIGQQIVSLTHAGGLLDKNGNKIKGSENKKIIFISEPFDILRFIKNENWPEDLLSQFK